MAYSLMKRARARHDDDEHVEFVAVPRSAVTAVVRDGPCPIELSTSSPTSSSSATSATRTPPDHPAESTPVAPLPRAAAIWRELPSFAAGSKGPVTLPVDPDRPLPDCPPGHVLIPASAVQLLLPRGSLPSDVPARAYLARKTAEEVKTGAVEYARWDQVVAILPMFVVVNEEGKQRIIFDGRALNAHLRDAARAVSYESVRAALYHSATVATKLDVASAFRHVLVDQHQRNLLGFVVEGRLMRYRTLPFGVSWSPALFVAALRPVIDRLRRDGLRIVWYVDDFLILADDVGLLDEALCRVLRELAAQGWYASPEKTYCYAYSAIPFLGLKVTLDDAGNSTLSILDAMRRKIIRDVDAMLTSGCASITTLQKVTGRLSFVRVVVTEVGFARTALDKAVAHASRVHRPVPVTGLFRQQLVAVRRLFDTDVLSRVISRNDAVADEPLLQVYSDASATGWGVIRVDPDGPFTVPPTVTGTDVRHPVRGWSVSEVFSSEELRQSSAAREILAVVKGIIALDLRSCRIAWHSDATAAVGAIRKWASPAPGVADALQLLWTEVVNRQLRIDVVHVARELDLMPVADWLSRAGWREAQAEWSFSADDVAAVADELGFRPDADLFASASNRRFPHYCSRFLEEGSAGDAFYRPWAGRRWWVFPPFSQRSRVLARLHQYAVQADVETEIRRLALDPASLASPSAILSSLTPTTSVEMVLITRPIAASDPDARIWSQLRRFVLRTAVVFRPSSLSSSSLSSRSSPRQILPHLRLLGDEGVPAPAPLNRTLLAHRIRIRGLPRSPGG